MIRPTKLFLVILTLIVINFVFASTVRAAISFSISNPVVVDDEIEVEATITGLTSSSNCSTTGCYLQGQIISAGGAFGYTYNNSNEYVDFFAPESVDEIKSKLFNFVPVSGSWSGKLKVKNNPENKNYYGPGEYVLVFRRFTGNSKSATSGDSNSLSVTLTASAPTPSPAPNINTPSPSTSPTPIVLKTAQPVSTPLKTLSPATIKVPTSRPKETLGPEETPSVLGQEVSVETPISSPVPAESPKNKFPFFAISLVGTGLFLISFAALNIFKSVKKGYTDESEKEDT